MTDKLDSLEEKVAVLEEQLDRLGHDEVRVKLPPHVSSTLQRIAHWKDMTYKELLVEVLNNPRGTQVPYEMTDRLRLEIPALRVYSKQVKDAKRKGALVRFPFEMMSRTVGAWADRWLLDVIEWLDAVVEDYRRVQDEDQNIIDSQSEQITDLHRELDLEKQETENRERQLGDALATIRKRNNQVTVLKKRLREALAIAEKGEHS